MSVITKSAMKIQTLWSAALRNSASTKTFRKFSKPMKLPIGPRPLQSYMASQYEASVGRMKKPT